MSENNDENAQHEENDGTLQKNMNSLFDGLGIKDSKKDTEKENAEEDNNNEDDDWEFQSSDENEEKDKNEEKQNANQNAEDSSDQAKTVQEDHENEEKKSELPDDSENKDKIDENEHQDDQEQSKSLENVMPDILNNLTNQSNDESKEQQQENGALEPILPPINDIHSPNYDEPQTARTGNTNSNLGILPPPQRRRSPTAARRSLKTDNSTKNDSFRKNYNLLQPSPPTYEEETMMNRILKGEMPTISSSPSDSKSITPEQLDRLIILFQEKRKEIAKKYNYQEGVKINEVISRLENLRNGYITKVNQDESIRQLNEEYEKFEQRRDEYDNETNKEIKDLQERQETQRNDIKASHEAKEDQLLETWGSAKKLRMYNRASNELTALRRQHAFLLVQNRFEEAKKIAYEIESKQNYELQSNHIQHQKDYDYALASLQEKNREEMDTFENKCAIEMATLMQQRKRGRKKFESKEQWFAKKRAEINEMTPSKSSTGTSSPKTKTSKMTTRSTLYDSPHNKPIMPSSKMTRKELGGSDVVILKLPPIQNRKIDTRKQTRNRK